MIYLGVFVLAALVTQLSTPLAVVLARRLDAIDRPDPRKVHSQPKARLGGVAIVLGVLAAIVPVLLAGESFWPAVEPARRTLAVLVACSLLVFAVGLVDDIRGVSAKLKLLSLGLATLTLCALGGGIVQVELPGVGVLRLGMACWPVTFLWVALITVGVNFIDGLDGLAAGVAGIACAAMAVLALHTGQVMMAALMLALTGSLAGFLFLNFNPARLFMGDCGSMFVGFCIAATSVACTSEACALGLALPAAALAVPIIDTGMTVIRRAVLDRRSLFAAERGHIHHCLLDRGLSQRRAVFAIYAMTLLGAGAGLFMLAVRPDRLIYVLGGVFGVMLLIFQRVGSVPLGRLLAAIGRNSAIARQMRFERNSFENAQLVARAARSLDDWWRAMGGLAEKMGFEAMSLQETQAGGILRWQRNGMAVPRQGMIRLSVPLANGQPVARLQVLVRADGSLEATGRRLTLMGRLIDEFGPGTSAWTLANDTEQVVGRYEACHRVDEAMATDGDAHSDVEPVAQAPAVIDVLGMKVASFESYAQAIANIKDVIDRGGRTWWVAMNPQKIWRALRDPQVAAVLREADVGICDGIGVSVASVLLHGRAIPRCTGCDLFFRLIWAAAEHGWRVFLLGASPAANDGAAVRLHERHPGLQIVGRRDGYFTPDQDDDVVARINQSQPDLLFVAMGSPKQEAWIAQHRHRLGAPLVLGVGGSFDVAAGLSRRAPAVFRRTGTEFLYQLVTQPWRWRRQIVYFPYMLRVIYETTIGRLTGSLAARAAQPPDSLDWQHSHASASHAGASQSPDAPQAGRRDAEGQAGDEPGAARRAWPARAPRSATKDQKEADRVRVG